jgi:hypothetical protein
VAASAAAAIDVCEIGVMPKQLPNKKQTKNKQTMFQTNKKTTQMPCGGRFLGRPTDK